MHGDPEQEHVQLTGEPPDATPQRREARFRHVSVLEWWRWKWHRSTKFRPALEITNGCISATCVFVYCYNTYIPIDEEVRIIYLIASVTFLIEYVARGLAANNKLKYMFWDMSLIDAATIAYGFFTYFVPETSPTLSSLSFIRILRMLQLMRFIRSISELFYLWLRGAALASQLELYKRSFDLFMMLFAVVFISGAAFYELELSSYEDGTVSYLHQAIYWACVTVSTIGYGDYYPTLALTQLLFPVLVACILLIIPSKVAALTSVFQNITSYMRATYSSWRFGDHIVLTGHANHITAKAFIDEFYHPDRGFQDMDTILLLNENPSPDMRMMLSGHRATTHLKYLQGSPFVSTDLARADITHALAVFVVCNKYARDPEQEDTNTTMTVLAISQYLRQNVDVSKQGHVFRGVLSGTSEVQGWGSVRWKDEASRWLMSESRDEVPHIVAQFHLPESITRTRQLLESQMLHPLDLGMLPMESSLFPICCGSIKHAMLGASLHTPGLLTLLSNLAGTSAMPPPGALEGCGWMEEYLTGAGHEVYEMQFPPEFDGLFYQTAATILFERHGVLLLGLRMNLPELDEHLRYSVQLAPFTLEYAIQAGVTVGYILSEDQSFSMQSTGFIPATIGPAGLKRRGTTMRSTSSMFPVNAAAEAAEMAMQHSFAGSARSTAMRPTRSGLLAGDSDVEPIDEEAPAAGVAPTDSVEQRAGAYSRSGMTSSLFNDIDLLIEPTIPEGQEAVMPIGAHFSAAGDSRPAGFPIMAAGIPAPRSPSLPTSTTGKESTTGNVGHGLFQQPADGPVAEGWEGWGPEQPMPQSLSTWSHGPATAGAQSVEVSPTRAGHSITSGTPSRPRGTAVLPGRFVAAAHDGHVLGLAAAGPVAEGDEQGPHQLSPSQGTIPEGDAAIEVEAAGAAAGGGSGRHLGILSRASAAASSGWREVRRAITQGAAAHDDAPEPSGTHPARAAKAYNDVGSSTTPVPGAGLAAASVSPPHKHHKALSLASLPLWRGTTSQTHSPPIQASSVGVDGPQAAGDSTHRGHRQTRPARSPSGWADAPQLAKESVKTSTKDSRSAGEGRSKNVLAAAAHTFGKMKHGPTAARVVPTKLRAASSAGDHARVMAKLTSTQSLSVVSKMTWPPGPCEPVIITGSSCFDHLDDLIAALRGVKRSAHATAAAAMRPDGVSSPQPAPSPPSYPTVLSHQNLSSLPEEAAGLQGGHVLRGGSSGNLLPAQSGGVQQAGAGAGAGGPEGQVHGRESTAASVSFAPLSSYASAELQGPASVPGNLNLLGRGRTSNSGQLQPQPSGFNGFDGSGLLRVPSLHRHTRNQQTKGHRLQFCPIVIMDQVGPTEVQAAQISDFDNVFVLKANPLLLSDMRRLNLPAGANVRAMVLPQLSSLSEEAVLGMVPSYADAEGLTVCSNLRQYCDFVAAALEIWTESQTQLNIAYLLPLCMHDAPYHGGGLGSSGSVMMSALKSDPSAVLDPAIRSMVLRRTGSRGSLGGGSMHGGDRSLHGSLHGGAAYSMSQQGPFSPAAAAGQQEWGLRNEEGPALGRRTTGFPGYPRGKSDAGWGRAGLGSLSQGGWLRKTVTVAGQRGSSGVVPISAAGNNNGGRDEEEGVQPIHASAGYQQADAIQGTSPEPRSSQHTAKGAAHHHHGAAGKKLKKKKGVLPEAALHRATSFKAKELAPELDRWGLVEDLKASVPPFMLPASKQQRSEQFVARLLAGNPSLAPSLASGHIFSASVLDKLLCQTLFNPLLVQIMTKMMGVWEVEEVEEEGEGEEEDLRAALAQLFVQQQQQQQGRAAGVAAAAGGSGGGGAQQGSRDDGVPRVTPAGAAAAAAGGAGTEVAPPSDGDRLSAAVGRVTAAAKSALEKVIGATGRPTSPTDRGGEVPAAAGLGRQRSGLVPAGVDVSAAQAGDAAVAAAAAAGDGRPVAEGSNTAGAPHPCTGSSSTAVQHSELSLHMGQPYASIDVVVPTAAAEGCVQQGSKTAQGHASPLEALSLSGLVAAGGGPGSQAAAASAAAVAGGLVSAPGVGGERVGQLQLPATWPGSDDSRASRSVPVAPAPLTTTPFAEAEAVRVRGVTWEMDGVTEGAQAMAPVTGPRPSLPGEGVAPSHALPEPAQTQARVPEASPQSVQAAAIKAGAPVPQQPQASAFMTLPPGLSSWGDPSSISAVLTPDPLQRTTTPSRASWQQQAPGNTAAALGGSGSYPAAAAGLQPAHSHHSSPTQPRVLQPRKGRPPPPRVFLIPLTAIFPSFSQGGHTATGREPTISEGCPVTEAVMSLPKAVVEGAPPPAARRAGPSVWSTQANPIFQGTPCSPRDAQKDEPLVRAAHPQQAIWYSLWTHCVVKRLLPIGLYRRDPATNYPYVYTAPRLATELRATDEVFIIASSWDLPE